MTRLSTPSWTPHAGTSLDVALRVLRDGPVSRADLARSMALSAASLTRLTQPLLEDGLLVEVGEHLSGQAGRPSRLLDVVPGSRHFIGLKLTGDRVLGVVTDLRANVLTVAEVPLESREPEAVVAVIAGLVRELAATVDRVTAVGIGIGALVGPGGTIISAPFLEWRAVEFAALLERSIDLPVLISNDITAFTEYERWFGGGRALDRFAVITIGAGIGYGLVVGGEIVGSEDAGLGLVGHWPIDPMGPLCAQGHRGCAQTMLSSEGIVASVSGALGRSVGYDEALRMAEQGVPAARVAVDNAGRGLGYLIAAVGNLTMPQLVILGGEGVRLAHVAHHAMTAGLAERRHAQAAAIDILTTAGDDTEWCRGAAVLALQAHVLGADNSSVA